MKTRIAVVIVLSWSLLPVAQADDLTPEQKFQQNTAIEAQLRVQAKKLEIQLLTNEAIAQFNTINSVDLSPTAIFDKPLDQYKLDKQPVEGGKTYVDLNGEACEVTLAVYDSYREATCLPLVDLIVGCWGATSPYAKGDTYEYDNRTGRIAEVTAVCADSKNPGRQKYLSRGDSHTQGPIEIYDISTVQDFIQSQAKSK